MAGLEVRGSPHPRHCGTMRPRPATGVGSNTTSVGRARRCLERRARGPVVPRYFRDSVRISPDGRYVASLVGGHVFATTHGGVVLRADPWPSVVIADAATCAPLFRVRSAYTYELVWDAAGCRPVTGSSSACDDGYMILQVRPTPDLVRLPGIGAPDSPIPRAGAAGALLLGHAKRAGPRTGSHGRRPLLRLRPQCVRRASRIAGWAPRSATRTGTPGSGGTPTASAGSRSRRIMGRRTCAWVNWLLLPPVIEFPPFSDVIAFRVAGTGSCLRLRAAPEVASEIIGCLPDGARLVLTEPAEPPPDRARLRFLGPSQPHPAVAWMRLYHWAAHQ